MGLQSNDQQEVLSIVSAVLHLGNITFKEKGNYADVADKQCEYIYHCFFHFFFLSIVLRSILAKYSKIQGAIYIGWIRLVGIVFT